MVVGYPAKRGVVAAASYEARRFGVLGDAVNGRDAESAPTSFSFRRGAAEKRDEVAASHVPPNK